MLWTSCNRRCAGGAVGCMHSPVGLLGPLGGSPSWGLSRATFLLQFHCCGSNNSQDWQDSEWIRSDQAGGRVVPDSCCKTVVPGCGQRDHASNIYKVEVGRWGPGLPGGGLRGPGPGCWWGGWCGHTRRGLGAAAAGGLDLLAFSAPTRTLPGRLHHQAGDLHPGAPKGHRGSGRWHRLCAGLGVGRDRPRRVQGTPRGRSCAALTPALCPRSSAWSSRAVCIEA